MRTDYRDKVFYGRFAAARKGRLPVLRGANFTGTSWFRSSYRDWWVDEILHFYWCDAVFNPT